MAQNEPQRKETPPGPLPNSLSLLFEYQCTSGKFIRLANRIESKKSIRQRESNRIESKLFLPELECSTTVAQPAQLPAQQVMIVRKWQIQYIAIRYIVFFRDSRSVAALLQRNFAAAITFSRAFQFGQKKVSVRFYSIFATESIFFDSIRFDNLINLPLVHRYSNSKLGVILQYALRNCFFVQLSVACIVVYFN